MTPKLPLPSPPPPPQPLRLPSSVLLLLLSLLIIPTSSHAYNFSASCNTTSTCGNLIKISYPFCFYEEIDVLSSSYCGYEGFKVTCGNNTPFLHSNDAKKYKITHIDYDAHIISIVDADIFSDQCLRLRHNFTLSPLSTLRYASSDANLTFFFDCADGPAEYRIPCNNNITTNDNDLEELDQEFVAMMTCDWDSDFEQHDMTYDWSSDSESEDEEDEDIAVIRHLMSLQDVQSNGQNDYPR
ncbi:LEAF RUST 10 DISEASE-RESISTANCE LOCUS RECEPTOR-LIKE PROTEIN KINASE-like [Canna indica]|uniref:LEAF RUST 10 DISEASE-RESISTANCE LOCUS RECEPTOR-LIKE PROTEIN KINASE-like n=1 Tax=Canna indica TaxID=4628 RepID=A0AAQ3PXT1_9LILI|nr:LEAF RUST 10 DISEASE-RESISTANCE LOCUS RECEPTOR-LIKE PROTEIN KINASE-like [Canna indica]